MNSRFLIVLVIALILAGGAAMIAKHWVESQPGNAEQNTYRFMWRQPIYLLPAG